MAKHNPFNIFRRNQKAWLAGLTLFTMFSFIVLGNMFQCVQQRNPTGAGNQNIYAKTSKYGDLDHVSFMNFREGLSRMQAFLEAATQNLIAAKEVIQYGNMLLVVEKDPKDPTKEFPILLDNLTALFQENGIALSNTEQVVDRWLITKTAQSQGYKANSDSVKEYLTLLFQNRLTQEDFNQAMRAAGLTFGQAMEIFGDQIIRERLFRAVNGGRRWTSAMEQPIPTGLANIASSPAVDFDACQRLYRKYKINVAAVEVKKFYGDVEKAGEPSDDVLKKLYDRYQFVTYNPMSKTPGFSIPTKMAFEVVRGRLTPERLAAVTPDEVKAYYEKNREQYKKPVPQQPVANPAQAAPLSLPGGNSPALTPLPDSVLTEVAAPESKPAEAKKEETKKPEAKPADVKKDEPKKSEAKPEEKKAEPAPKTSVNEAKSPFKLVAYETEAKPAGTKKEEPKKADAKPAEVKKEEPKKADAKPAEAKKEEPKKTDAKPAEVDDGYYKLSEVEESIRRKLAGDKLEAEMAKIYDEMSVYAKALAKKRSGVSKQTDVKEINLPEIAKKAGFDFMETTELLEGKKAPLLISLEEAQNLEVLPDSMLEEKYQSIPIEYSPENTGIVVDSIYIYWVTKVKAAYQPKYEEAREAVLEAWKKEKALEPAKKAADDLAAKVKSEKKPLAELAKSVPVPFDYAVSEKFSWFDFPRGFRNQGLTWGEIREEGVPYGQADKKNKVIVAPGDTFYETVSQLGQKGDVAVVANQPNDRMFVIELAEKDPDEVVLSQIEAMSSDPFVRQAKMVAEQRTNLRFYQDWLKELRKESGFEWITIPQEVK